MRHFLFAMTLIATVHSASATDYVYLTCADLGSVPGAVSHFIGWLNLRNRDRTTTEIDFKKGILDEIALERTCKVRPDLPLHLAVAETFSQIGDEVSIKITDAPPVSDHTASVTVK